MTYAPPDPSTYSIPSTGSRALRAGLSLIPSILLFVIVPYVGLTQLDRFGIGTRYSLGFIVLAGLVLAGIGAAASFARPTRAYGPLLVAGSVGSAIYLLLLARDSTIDLVFGQGGLALTYAGMMTAFALVPAIRAGSGVVTTLEDLLRPGERLPIDFPAR